MLFTFSVVLSALRGRISLFVIRCWLFAEERNLSPQHSANIRIKLDLDDGVKVDYGKFGDLLAEVKAVTGKK